MSMLRTATAVLAAVQGENCNKTAVLKRSEVAYAHVDRILRVLEGTGFIQLKRQGREVQVSRTAKGQRFLEAARVVEPYWLEYIREFDRSRRSRS